MAFTRETFAFLTCAAMIMFLHCNADQLPPPSNPKHIWLDDFTVNVSWSWMKPRNLSVNCKIKYELCLEHEVDQGDREKCLRRTEWKNFTDSCLLEGKDSAPCNYTIRTVCEPCDSWNDSTAVNVVVSPVSRAKVVNNFTCVLDRKGMNCSWIPVNSSLDMKLFYRYCGSSEERRNGLKECVHPYKNGCYLYANGTELCFLAVTELGQSTFKPSIVIPSPKMSIREDKHNLHFNWTTPEVGVNCEWKYNLCFTQCKEREQCLIVFKPKHRISYNENCRYEFRSRVLVDTNCQTMISDWSKAVTYGTNKLPNRTLTVAAILIPIALFVCVILSCYCFRKHSDIICPIIPDPSAIFKEMMMNGNKELKPMTGSLYTPVPEPIEPCKILVTEDNVSHQNSWTAGLPL
ncbi:interleukin-13 receptor subunit alpha-1 [Lates calcarifer]|uniref:Interleukin-13 receptor subunit alpha-1 n=1 Tax=Lates calcarifer TaxID=8187 RepID=A0A4W6D5C3_LATCA|nr:interleukin-13 receptor subunit alpha-1 [Lates calcarifer]